MKHWQYHSKSKQLFSEEKEIRLHFLFEKNGEKASLTNPLFVNIFLVHSFGFSALFDDCIYSANVVF